ncbi:MAG: hypothetical protein M1814_000247 [Vezdaea aestivalis]|nr:MAG: hypothetical protein M1814_000247 [Vezdaea aestivalis]
MPRSAADATKFTATGLHAHRKSPVSVLPPSSPNPPPNGESPKEKVARLRAAAIRARADKVPRLERIIAKGRTVADTAHRVVAVGLIGFTGIVLVGCTYVLGDMVLYNRRKRAEYFAWRTDSLQRAMTDAKAAFSTHSADYEQVDLVYRHELLAEVQEKEKARGGPWKRTTQWLFSGLKQDQNDPYDSGEREAVGSRADLLENTFEGKRQWVERRLGIPETAMESATVIQQPKNASTRSFTGSIQEQAGALVAAERAKRAEEVKLQQGIRRDGGILDTTSEENKTQSSVAGKTSAGWFGTR